MIESDMTQAIRTKNQPFFKTPMEINFTMMDN